MKIIIPKKKKRHGRLWYPGLDHRRRLGPGAPVPSAQRALPHRLTRNNDSSRLALLLSLIS